MLTKTLLYLLLVVYAVNMVKPVLPYVKDTVSHIFWYAEHGSTVHFENGRYHVHAEAMKQIKKTDLPKAALPGKATTDLSEHISSEVGYLFAIEIPITEHFPSFHLAPLTRFIEREYLPPRA